RHAAGACARRVPTRADGPWRAAARSPAAARPGCTDRATRTGARRPLCRSPRRRLRCPYRKNTIPYRETCRRASMNTPNRPLTLPEKVRYRHLVDRDAASGADAGSTDLLYIDLHLVHEVTSPQAFDGLRLSGRSVRRPELTVATEDHNVPTADIDQPIADPISAKQVDTLRANAAEFGVPLYPMGDPNRCIVHVIAPEQGRTLLRMTVVDGH